MAGRSGGGVTAGRDIDGSPKTVRVVPAGTASRLSPTDIAVCTVVLGAAGRLACHCTAPVAGSRASAVADVSAANTWPFAATGGSPIPSVDQSACCVDND